MTAPQLTPKPAPPTGAPIMDAAAIRRALKRIAHEIIERNPDLASVVPGGHSFARRRDRPAARGLHGGVRKTPIATGVIDVSMHRDDVRPQRAAV